MTREKIEDIKQLGALSALGNEIKNNLNIVHGYLTCVRDNFDTLEDSVERSKEILDEILELYKEIKAICPRKEV